MIPNIDFGIRTFLSQAQEKTKLNLYSDLFLVSGIDARYGDHYINDVFGNEKEILNQLIKNNGLMIIEKITYNDKGYRVSNNYLKNFDIVLNENQVLISDKDKLPFEYRSYKVIETPMIRFPNLDKDMFNLRSSYQTDAYLDEWSFIIYSGEPQTVLNTIFSYDGNVEEAQTYINNLMSQMGFEPCYRISSLTDNYYLSKNIFLNSKVIDLIINVLLLLLYILESKQLYRAYLQVNARKIIVKLSLGYSVADCLSDLLIIDVLIMIAADIFLYVFFELSLTTLSYLSVFVFFIEILILSYLSLTINYMEVKKYI